MGTFNISELPEIQKACLRLIFQGYEIKEIGLRFGLSHYTVTECLRAARRATNTQNSMEAARLLAIHEQIARNTKAVNSSNVISPNPDAVPSMPLSIISLWPRVDFQVFAFWAYYKVVRVWVVNG